MRVFQNVKEAIKEIERDVHEMGIIISAESVQDKITKGLEEFDSKEVRGYSYTIKSFNDLDFIFDFFPKIPRQYCEVEFLERVSPWGPINPGTAWTFRKNIWEEFLREGKFSYTYNERIYSRLSELVDQLIYFPNTRQGIMCIFNPELDYKNIGGQGRIPCSMYYQFFIRENKLHLIYNMRSCDFYTHFGVDIWLGIKLLIYIAEKIDKCPGDFIHFIGSLHYFRKDKDFKEVF